MTHFTRIISTLLAGAFFLSPAYAGDHKDDHQKHDPIKRMMKKLDLSDEQHDAIKEIQHQFKEKQRANKDHMMEIHKGMKEQVLSTEADQEQIRYFAHQKALLVEKMTIAKANTMHQIYNELTPKQQEKMRHMMDKMHEKMQKKKHH